MLSTAEGRPLPAIKLAADDQAAWGWIATAVGIYQRQWFVATGYGLLFVVIGFGIAATLFNVGLVAATPVAIGAFGLVGPLMAAGLYQIAKADEEGRRATLREVLLPKAASPLQIAYLGSILLVAVFLWLLAARGLIAIFASGVELTLDGFLAFAFTTPMGLLMVCIGSIMGGAIALTIFAISAFSFPMMMDRETDFMTAVAVSLRMMIDHPRMMLLWAWIIGLCIAAAGGTMMLAFIFLFPLLGFATWAGYRERLCSDE